MLTRRHALAGGAALLGAPLLGAAPARAQAKNEVLISRQPGVLYLPTHVIETQGLLEKHAARLGLKGLTARWLSFSNGGAQQDALLAGGVDVINTGTAQLLLLWDRTKGGVKGIVASSAQPLQLITREDRIRSPRDLAPGDKVAVPTVRTSTQAILLQMAAGQLFGADQWNRFDALTVQLGHPDALIAMRNASHEVRTHFAAPPFQTYELKSVPGARVVATSADIIGGPLTQGQFFTTTKFADANPVVLTALRAAAVEAREFIRADPKGAVDAYRTVTSDKTDAAELLDLLAGPGMDAWDLAPQGTMKFAAHLHRTGTLKTLPTAWSDYYLPAAHDLPGS